MTAHAPLPELQLQSLARTVEHWLPRPPLRPDLPHDGRELFDLQAPYQRASVWNVGQRQGLIKSLLMGLPVGAIITSELPYLTPGGPSYRVVDGKQRIEAVRAFAVGELWVPAWWFDQRDLGIDPAAVELVSGPDLSDRGRRTFGNRQLPELMFRGEVEFLHPNEPPAKGWATRRRTPDELLLAEAELYLLINGAGTPHTEADLARAAGLLP